MSHEPYETHAAVYALGALDGADREAFEAHVGGGCATCAEILHEHGETLADVARDAPPMIPPARVKGELLRRIAATDPARVSRRRRRWIRWTVASAAAVVGVSVFMAGLVASRYEARIGLMARETARVRADLHRQEAALRDRLALAQGVMDLLLDPATRVVALQGTGPAAGAAGVGRLVWHEANGGYLFVTNVPAPPAGKTYELWTIAEGKPRAAGVFTVDASGRATHPVAPTRAPVQVFAVTLEPEGGVPAPTGPIVLASSK
jgi:anti-sigma-K factor RskA